MLSIILYHAIFDTFNTYGDLAGHLKQQASNKSISAGGATALLGTAVAVALFATGMVAVELMPIMIAVAAVTIAALAVSGIIYSILKPSTKMDGTEEAQSVKEISLGSTT